MGQPWGQQRSSSGKTVEDGNAGNVRMSPHDRSLTLDRRPDALIDGFPFERLSQPTQAMKQPFGIRAAEFAAKILTRDRGGNGMSHRMKSGPDESTIRLQRAEPSVLVPHMPVAGPWIICRCDGTGG